MLCLVRKQFPDLCWDSEQLEAAAEMLLAWYRASRSWSLFSSHPEYLVEFRLEGFPRAQAGALLKVLRQHLVGIGRPDDQVEMLDLDTLVLKHSASITESTPVSSWLKLLSLDDFNGLLLTIRLTIGEWRDQPVGDPRAGGGVVLAGFLQDGYLLLKGAWPAGSDAFPEFIYEHVRWPKEEKFLDAVNAYREHHRLSAVKDWRFLFSSRWAKLCRRAARIMLLDVGGERTLRSTVIRIVFFAALLAVAEWRLGESAMAAWLGDLGILAFGALACLAILGLVYSIGLPAWRIWLTHSKMKASFQRLYSQPISHVEVALEEEPVLNDVICRKWSADIEALGAKHWFDFRIEGAMPQRYVNRVYLLPMDSAYLTLGLVYPGRNLQGFPAQPVLIESAYFTDGSRFFASNTGAGFAKQRTANVFARCFAKRQHPEEFVANCRRVLKRLTAQEGSRLLAPFTKDEFHAKHEAQHEEARRLKERYGYYTWTEAFRQVFGLGRREYNEPEQG
jgi:hypothetical protein